MAVDGQYRKLVMRAAGATTAQILADCRGYGHKDLPCDHPVRQIRIAKGGLCPLEAGMRIAVAEIDEAPAGVDTEEDLAATRRRLGH